MKTAIIESTVYRKGEVTVCDSKRMPLSTAKALMNLRLAEFKERGLTIFSTIFMSGMCLQFNAIRVTDGEPVELHTYKMTV